MPVLIERTGKTLKLLRVAALIGIQIGAAAYLFSDFVWALPLALFSAVALGLSKLLMWWRHS